MEKIRLSAKKRNLFGRRVDSLRKAGILPSIIYGHNFSPVPLEVNYKEFERVFNIAGYSTLIFLDFDGQSQPVIIREVQKDPINDNIIHVDFYRVSLKEKVKSFIPLVFIGGSEAVKSGKGILVKVLDKIEVEGLPEDLPHQIEVDVSGLKNPDDIILVKDLKIPKNIKVLTNLEEVIAGIKEQKEEVEKLKPVSIEDVKIVEDKKRESEEK